MSRFREEYYSTKAHKAFARGVRDAKALAPSDAWASRAEYLKKPSPVRKAILKAQAQARLNGF